MSWKEKADEIAVSIIKDMKSFDRDSVSKALHKAAILGMEFDSYNWCNHVR